MINLAHFEEAKDAALAAASLADAADALLALERQLRLARAEQAQAAWAEGRKGEGVSKVDGLTTTETQLLRLFAAHGVVTHDQFPELSRHVSHLRKAFRAIAPEIEIETLRCSGGYALEAGFEGVYRLLNGRRRHGLGVGAFTVKETMILRLLIERPSLHKDQIHCLGKHVSNMRKKLGPDVKIAFVGDGQWTIAKEHRKAVKRWLSGKDAPPAKAKRARGKPTLTLVAA